MPNNIPEWDLSDLYESLDDPAIFLSLKKVQTRARQFSKKHKDKIKPGIKAVALLKIIKEYENIIESAVKPPAYCMLMFSKNSADQKTGALMQASREGYIEIKKDLLFLELNIPKLPKRELEHLTKHPLLANYRHFLKRLADFKPHMLSEDQEKIFQDKALTTASFVRLFDQIFSQKQFNLKNGKKIGLEQVLKMMEDPDRKKRKAASDSLSEGINVDSSILSLIYNTLIKDKAVSDRWHNFYNPEHSRHMDNEISRKTVDALTSSVIGSYSLAQKYYRIKKNLLGLKQMRLYDRHAPVLKSRQKIPFSQAKRIVVGAFSDFSEVFKNTALKFFENKWIDAKATPSKRGGAFCASITPHTHPLILMNYLNTPRDVKTLAHELGHGINGYLMRKQTMLNYDNPLTLAETASVFCELLVFEKLVLNAKNDSEKLDLYMDEIQNIISTVQRQISMFTFERAVHDRQKEKGEIPFEELNSIWRKSQEKLYAKQIILDKKHDCWWAYIPHFVHSPFYVYAYAFGELLVLSLYAQYKNDPKSFVPNYIKLMEAGSTDSPAELLKPFMTDIDDPLFWKQGLSYLKTLLDDAQKLAARVRVNK
jgi:oligoendopeptidase F